MNTDVNRNNLTIEEHSHSLSAQILDSLEQYDSNGDIVIIATYTFLSSLKNPEHQNRCLAILKLSATNVVNTLIERYGRKHSTSHASVSSLARVEALDNFMSMAQAVITGQSRVNAWLPEDSSDIQTSDGFPEYVFAIAFELTLSQPERRDVSYGDTGDSHDQLRVVTTLARHDGENYLAFDFMEQQKHLN
jgi:hypothetical protein